MSADIRFDSLKTIVPAVSRETADRLIAFEDLFRKWSKAINLASPRRSPIYGTGIFLIVRSFFLSQKKPRAGWISVPVADFRGL